MISFFKRLIHRSDNLYERDMQFIAQLQREPVAKRRRNRR